MLAQEFRQHGTHFQVGLLVCVHRVHGHVLDHGAHRVQAKQHVGFKKVALFQLVQRQLGQHAGARCGVAVGRVHQVPVAATELGHERQHGVAKQPHRRHPLHRFRPEKPVALGVIGFAAQQRKHEVGQQGRVHLPVAVDLHHNVHAIGNRRLVGGDKGSTHPPVVRVVQHPHAWIVHVLLNEQAAAIGAGVVHGIDGFDLGADGRNHVQHMLRDFVAGDGHGNAHFGFFQDSFQNGFSWQPMPRLPGSRPHLPACASAGVRPQTARPVSARSETPAP